MKFAKLYFLFFYNEHKEKIFTIQIEDGHEAL